MATVVAVTVAMAAVETAAADSTRPLSPFRFINGRCQDSTGKSGTNPDILAECGDLTFVPGGRRPRPNLPENLQYQKLNGLRLKLNLLVKMQLTGAELNQADLRETDLSGAHLSRIRGVGMLMNGAILHNAELDGAELRRADLSGVRARQADLRAADLQNAQLVAADLTLADLSNADLRGADLHEAIVFGADFTGAKFNSATRLPFSSVIALARGMVLQGSAP